MLKFNKHKAMNERIIDRKLFVDLAKEVGLNASQKQWVKCAIVKSPLVAIC